MLLPWPFAGDLRSSTTFLARAWRFVRCFGRFDKSAVPAGDPKGNKSSGLSCFVAEVAHKRYPVPLTFATPSQVTFSAISKVPLNFFSLNFFSFKIRELIEFFSWKKPIWKPTATGFAPEKQFRVAWLAIAVIKAG